MSPPHGDFIHTASAVIYRQAAAVHALAEALRAERALAGDCAERIIRGALAGCHDQAHLVHNWGGLDAWVAEQCDPGKQAAAQRLGNRSGRSARACERGQDGQGLRSS